MTDSPLPVYRIGVLSDTHGVLRPRVFELFEGVDLILHAGDIGNEDILMALKTIAPVRAVTGNVDYPPLSELPATLQLTTFLGKVAMTHGHLTRASAYHPETLAAFFREFEPRVVIYGHTHLASISVRDGMTLFNPGAAGKVRVAGRHASVGMITLDEGQTEPRIEHMALE